MSLGKRYATSLSSRWTRHCVALLSLCSVDQMEATFQLRCVAVQYNWRPHLSALLKVRPCVRQVPRRRVSSRQRTSRFMGVGSSNRKNQWQARILVHGKARRPRPAARRSCMAWKLFHEATLKRLAPMLDLEQARRVRLFLPAHVSLLHGSGVGFAECCRQLRCVRLARLPRQPRHWHAAEGWHRLARFG